jgi:hypothetical protein
LALLNSNKLTYEKIILLLLMLCSITTFGQYAKIQEDIDLSIAFGQSFAPSLSYQKLYGLGKNKRFKMGWGLRANGLFGGEKPIEPHLQD